MKRHATIRNLCAAIACLVLAAAVYPLVAAEYKLDSAHTSVAFRINHMGLSHVYGLFTKAEGDFTWDENNLGDSEFNFKIDASSVNTGNEKRDGHLQSADFFNVKQFPVIAFKSSKVSETADGYEVTGELTMHGQKKTLTIPLEKIGQKDNKIGFASEFTVDRTDFGIDGFENAVGNQATLMVSFEGETK